MQVLFIGMRENCVNSIQHLISNYMKTMGTKRTSKKQKGMKTNHPTKKKTQESYLRCLKLCFNLYQKPTITNDNT
jgi:hypothetical protein